MRIFRFVLILIFSVSSFAGTPVPTSTLALKLWMALEKEQNVSYTALDNYRIKLDKNDPMRKVLFDQNEFKRLQTVLRNNFISRVSKEFSRKEIINLTKIYKRPEMEKLRLFSMNFWDEKSVKESLERDTLYPSL